MYFEKEGIKIHSYLKWCFIEKLDMDIVSPCNRIENEILDSYLKAPKRIIFCTPSVQYP